MPYRILVKGYEESNDFGEFESGLPTEESAKARVQEIVDDYALMDQPLDPDDIFYEEEIDD